MHLIVLPAVDIMDGKAVQLVGGKPGTEKVVLPDPVEVARRWEKFRAPGLHVVDLDGALDRGENLGTIERIIKRVSIPVQVGGGIRSTETVDDLIGWGVDKVVLGTRAIRELEWLKEVTADYPRRIVLAIDMKGGKVQLKGWQESSLMRIGDLFENIRDVPLAGVLHTNVDVEGRGVGIDPEEMGKFIRSCPHPVVASGGIKNMDDILLLAELGAQVAIVGMALYTGDINPEKIWGGMHGD
ncbi:MAG: 1-(5-phosphoribosyl)-5-[(5-phosphoribosylamino)methylideneamino] imidazole-4-carboxamide isomerase [Methanomassiliicoccales archaeon]|jgi:phosphoribosylformimino-5-aminoimidazole carboxamide ribotide isomerase